jgi:dTMP kinase
MSAVLVAIEGIDGSGKGTQAERLQTALQARGLRPGLMRFPQYEQTCFGRTIGRYLNGEFGTLDAVGAHFAALLYAGDRFESLPRIRAQQADRDVLIFDRYVPSNLAHQAAKLPAAARTEFVQWVEQIEYGVYGLPRPDLVVWLDMPVADAVQLVARKPRRAYTARTADLHESDTEYLTRTRSLYAELAVHDASWRVVQCRGPTGLRTVDDLHAELLETILQLEALAGR